jgi:DNA repair exonuclease SbcCD ATPase subunit
MKLLSLKLFNFRPFFGEHRLMFAKSQDRNITVIYGNNGSGKTALLNAFTWTLYEKFTAALSSPEYLVNRRAIAEAKVGESIPCWVEVEFDHDGKQYRLKRSIEVLIGSLDEVYWRQVAKLLPALADQVIVIATQTQWRGEVEEEMLSRIGKVYVLTYNSPKPDLETDEIDCFGQRYSLS